MIFSGSGLRASGIANESVGREAVRRSRNRARTVLLVTGVACLLASSPAGAAESGIDRTQDEAAVDSARDSVFRILVQSAVGEISGTGFAVGTDRVLTNAHVIDDAEAVAARNRSGSEVPCSVVRVSDDVDLALLDCDTAGVDSLEVASAIDNGTRVVAIGYPLGGAERVTHGVVTDAVPDAEEMISVDAALDKGNSGGPVLSVSSGRVLGVATAVDPGDRSASFAVSAYAIRRFLAERTDEPANESSEANGRFDGAIWEYLSVYILGIVSAFAARGLVRRIGVMRDRNGAPGRAEPEIRVNVRPATEPEPPIEVVLIGESDRQQSSSVTTHDAAMSYWSAEEE